MGIARLDGIWAKLDRAEEHFNTADSEIRAFAADHPDAGWIEFRQEEGWHMVYLHPLPTLPQHIAPIAGDGFHNMRTALDHLVWQLVLREDQKLDNGNCFPICQRREDFGKVRERAERGESSPLCGIPLDGDTWTLIAAAQPFQYPDPKNHPLLRLARVDNIDKHRTLLAQQHFPDWNSMVHLVQWPAEYKLVEQERFEDPLSLEQPTKIARYHFAPGVNVPMHVDGAFRLRTTLGDEVTRVTRSEVTPMAKCIVEIVKKVEALPRVQR